MIRDRIVFGCSNPKVREKLISVGEKLTMDKAIKVVKNFEYCQEQLSSMSLSAGNNVDAVNKRSSNFRRQSGASRQGQTGTRRRKLKQSNDDQCRNCGTIHAKNKCPAYGKICHSCDIKNYYAKIYRSTKTVPEICEPCEHSGATGYNKDLCDKDYFIDTVDMISAPLVSSSPDREFATLLIGPGKRSLSFKVDTGSAVNILPYSYFSQLKVEHPLEASEQKLTSYTGDLLHVQGTIKWECCHKDKVIETQFYVVENSAPPLICLQSSLDLGLLKLTYSVESSPSCTLMSKESMQRDFADLFAEIGVLPGTSKLYLKENSVPIVNPPRRVTQALKSKVKDELDRMEKDSIITSDRAHRLGQLNCRS